MIKSFLEFCLKRAGDKPLKVFQEDKRIGVTVKAIEAADGPLFMAEWNIYDDNTDNEYEIDLVTKVLIEAAERKNSVQSTKVTYDWLGGLIDKHLAPVERREKRAEKKTDAAKEPSRPVDTKMFAVRLASINGYSFHDFIAQYMSPDKGEGRSGTSRLSSLRAFQENKDLKGAQVAIDKSATPYAFTVTVPAGSGGTADMNTYNIVCHILGEAQQTWARAQEQRERSQANVEFSSINKEWFKTRIKEIVEKTADGGLVISPVFKTQAQGRVMLPGSAVPGREIVHGDKLAGRFHAAAEVSNLPDFTPDGSLIFRHEILTPTDNQRILMDLIDTKDIVFADGPAGSGKTLWTCFMALQGLRQGRYQKIAIAAPAVEAEEQHGFLPGSINKKMDPFINQILETFDEILGNGDSYVGKPLREKLVSTGLIEIAPHAFNRGRTYKNTLYILDECQNASWKQLMTALTRLGTGSTFVFMGDDRQNDRTSKQSAFVNFVRRFTKDTYQDYIGAVKFGPADVRRHPLLKLIMEEGDDVAPEEFKYGQDSRSGRNGSGGYRPRTPEPPEPGPRAVPSTVAPQ